MGKRPHIERCPMNGGITGECAYNLCKWLAHEADMNDDVIAYSKWIALMETLTPYPGVPMAASVHYKALDEEIEKWNT